MADIHDDRRPLYVVVSVDVEEEGLFSGHYQSQNLGTQNVSVLPRLAPLSRELGFPLTLFCSHAVLTDSRCCAVLERMRSETGAEIGAHLHHWSTPPYAPQASGEPESPARMPRSLLAEKLDRLFEAGRNFLLAPMTSFRMGRWDLAGCLRPLLAERDIKVDSSVCPLRARPSRPDHFLAPADPYWSPECPGLLESPVTQLPVLSWLPALWHKLGRNRREMLDLFHFFGALSPNPMWHAGPQMRSAAHLHYLRGGQVLSLFWHSSELFPGGSPATPDERSALAHLEKITSFLTWLRKKFNVIGVRASELHSLALQGRVIAGYPPQTRAGDW